jgi:ABC-type multidrug transport system ATPase subunit
MNSPSIQIPEGLKIGYGRTEIARAVEVMDLGPGNHFLLARNGRGKTTLLRTLSRSLPTLSGTPVLNGRVQFIGEALAFDGDLPARVVFKTMLDSYGYRHAMELAERIELDVGKPFGRLSKGNRQKVLLVLAEYRARPDEASIVLLDEPFTGLDAHARDTVLSVWESRTQGILRLITTHPDYDSMDLRRPVVITDGEIRLARPEEGRAWGQIKRHLN